MNNTAGDFMSVLEATEKECLSLEVDNGFNYDYNERLQKTCVAMEAYVKRCADYTCNYRSVLVDCRGCKRKVHHKSAGNRMKYPVCANRKPISDQQTLVPVSPPTSHEVTILTELLGVVTIKNEHIDEGPHQARIQHYTERIRMANATTLLGQLRAESEVINAKFRDLMYNHDLLKRYTSDWRFFMTKMIRSPLYCPHCCTQVKIQKRRAQRPSQSPRTQIKSEVKREITN